MLKIAVCMVAGFAVSTHSRPLAATGPLDCLVHSAPRTHRRVEARLSGGFRWAAFEKRGVTREARIEEAPMQRCAGEILMGQSSDSGFQHATAMAFLLTQSATVAVPRFEELTSTTPQGAAVWNDLAVSRHELAQSWQEPAGLPAALAAVDRALALAPDFPEAAFNRALILTDLGLVAAAKDAWRHAAVIDEDFDWSREANLRLAMLKAADPPPFSVILQRALSASDAGDAGSLHRLARTQTQELRMAGEALALNAWPEAIIAGDAPRGERALSHAQAIAREIQSANGDALLSDVLDAIERARREPSNSRRIAAAHRAYREARITYHRQLPDSDVQLEHAAVLFETAGSPMVHVARYYSANAMFDRNRAEDSRRTLLRVLRDVDERRYPSLAGGAAKQLGIYYAFQGMWSTSLLHLDHARDIYSRAGELTNAAFTEAIIGEVHDRIGQFGVGWRHRRAALAILSRSDFTERVVSVLAGAVHAEILRGDWESALSLVRIANRHAARTQNPLLIAETLLREARVLLMTRGRQAASRVLRQAEDAVQQIRDPLTRSRTQASVWLVESEITRQTDPHVAREIVTRVIAFYEAKQFHMLLPPAYLERGRASLAAGLQDQALTDFLVGLAEVERQRTNVAPDIRMTVFDTAADLLAEAIDLLLVRGRTTEAYALIERARARTLIESLGVLFPTASTHVDVPSISRALPPRTVLVEYALLPKAIAAFCIRREGLSVIRLPTAPQDLREQIATLAAAVDERRPAPVVNGIAAGLHRALIAPLASALAGADALIIVPDRYLNAIPFAALFDETHGRYLIEDYKINIAPSGAFTLQRRRERRLEPLLMINAPGGGSSAVLQASQKEASGVAGLYENVMTLHGPAATPEKFMAAVPRSAVFHYAGHAQSTEGGGFLSLARSARNDGRIDAASISRMRLDRTSLVVLAACETLHGNVHRVEGMPSLARAFLSAGVPTVVGTLWEVDDRSAAALFTTFHELLRRGHSPSAALQAAQCALLRGDRESLRHPAAWAAAAVLGID